MEREDISEEESTQTVPENLPPLFGKYDVSEVS